MRRSIFFFIVLLCSIHSASAGGYLGNKLLEILGEDKNGTAINQFRSQFILDKSLKNPILGIKLTAAHDSGSVVTAITLTAAGSEMNDIKYKQFDGALPFDISFEDDAAALEQKLGAGKGAEDDTKMKYKKNGITINVFFKSNAKKKVSSVKFTQNIGMEGPYRVDGNHDLPVMLADAVASPTDILKAIKPDARVNNRNVTSLPAPASFGRTSAASERASEDPFYNAIMNVIESGEEEMFKDIKKEATPKTNFWNYKYTFSTSVAIPGEKYNMLYSFPFQNSQLDFVSVLEESDMASPAIQAKYAEVETKLKEYFKTTEGWSYHYVVNQEDPKGIKDFELKNPKLGSIVLDHSINPYGKHVLYLRFLLQYT